MAFDGVVRVEKTNWYW